MVIISPLFGARGDDPGELTQSSSRDVDARALVASELLERGVGDVEERRRVSRPNVSKSIVRATRERRRRLFRGFDKNLDVVVVPGDAFAREHGGWNGVDVEPIAAANGIDDADDFFERRRREFC